MRLSDSRRFGLTLALIAGVGLALRVAYVLILSPDTEGRGDALFYHLQANLIGDGFGFVEPFGVLLEGISRPTAFHPPLFSYLLGAVSAIGGESWTAQRLTGCLIGVATVVFVAMAARRYAGAKAGLAAAAVAALYPVLIAADGAVMSESLYTALIAATLAAAVWCHDEPGVRPAAALGVAIGLAALTRSEALALVVLLALPLAWRAGRGTRRAPALAAVAATALCVLPWTVRNYVEFDRVVPVSAGHGTLMGGANCDRTYSGPQLGTWDIHCAARPGDSPDELQRNDDSFDRALDYIGDHPGEVPAVMAVRLLRTADLWQPLRQARGAEGREPRFAQAGVLAFYLLVPVGLYGAVLLRRGSRPLLPLVAPIVLVAAISLIGWGNPRFRAAAEVPLVICVGVALSSFGRGGPSAAEPVAPTRTS